MEIVIQKFGGSILNNIDDIPKIGAHIIKELQRGNFPVVVVSAFFGETNKLINQFKNINLISKKHSKSILELVNSNKSTCVDSKLYNELPQNNYNIARDELSNNKIENMNNISANLSSEMDMALSTAEGLTSSLLAYYLNKIGFKARSLMGWQVPIYTNNQYQNSKIIKINDFELKDLIKQQIIPVIAGFQGVTNNLSSSQKNLNDSIGSHSRITTLGRGGSDITAISISRALKAKRVDIYKDVVGIMSGDPTLIQDVKPIMELDSYMMYLLSRAGVKALNCRAAALAFRYNIPVRIVSFKNDNQYTYISPSFEARDYFKKTQVINKFNTQINPINMHNIEIEEVINIALQTNLVKINFGTKNTFLEIIKLTKIIENKAKVLPIKITESFLIYCDPDQLNEIINIDCKLEAEHVSLVTLTGFNLLSIENILDILYRQVAELDLKIILADLTEIKIEIVLKGRQYEKLAENLHKIFIKQ